VSACASIIDDRRAVAAAGPRTGSDQTAPAGRRAPNGARPRVLDPQALSKYIDPLYRAAWALCGSPHDAEDLVQETFVNVLKRPRLLRDGNEMAYLMRALRNTFASRYRKRAQQPREHSLTEDDVPVHDDGGISAREIMEAIASAPTPYREAVIAVDVLGLSYREAAQALQARESTITTRVYRGRRHVARALSHGVGAAD
jgi:RNA polymerase sigma-70 factor, ECF subfamily